MKKIVVMVLFICVSLLSYGQSQPKVGDKLMVKAPSAQFYNHISFPQLNILVKRGKTSSYKPVIGSQVVVADVVSDDNNENYVVLKKEDGTKFFGLYATVKANYKKALQAGELVLVTN
ncbi:hypothetical protein KO494_15000 [Lacinutrix sp. C3R15]|uniref:hypothetical protein n=1 Tax=Flavobacteriaceae TaxID=49546 RepID=UPI001C08D36E|nr:MULTISPECIES: hypothetical protein [Flavobacteriaceae]MBU2940855.1 hypothetical protein [Lacinutrix sp. C3R15]MDO6624173.1 hypothetical protein [Oceanihabitans sp. 1_MG-2023]